MSKGMAKRASNTSGQQQTTRRYVRLHCAIGWWSLLVFVSLGIFLESLHAFKVSWYLNVGVETRRLLWTLAHAHGTLMGLLNIAFGYTVSLFPAEQATWRALASRCLIGATIAVPGGFFLGGITIYSNDPGLGIILLPLGALLLWVAVLLTALRRPA